MFLRTLRRRGGFSSVETALVLPILLLMMFMLIDFGRYFYVQHTIQNATREGMRLGLVGRILPGAVTRERSIEATIQMAASRTGINYDNLVITITPVGSDFKDPEGLKDGDKNAGQGGNYMRIKVKYPFTGFASVLGKNTRWIQAEALYRNEMF